MSCVSSLQLGDPGALFSDAIAQLVAHQYNTNMINLKIETPIDDNFSDDELTFLPYYTLFRSSSTVASQYPEALLSIRRTYSFVRELKSDLWNAIYIAVDGEFASQSDMASMVQ